MPTHVVCMLLFFLLRSWRLCDFRKCALYCCGGGDVLACISGVARRATTIVNISQQLSRVRPSNRMCTDARACVRALDAGDGLYVARCMSFLMSGRCCTALAVRLCSETTETPSPSERRRRQQSVQLCRYYYYAQSAQSSSSAN